MSMKLPFFNKKKKVIEEDERDAARVPDHIAIIMDGNGRWAEQRELPRNAGHKEGMDVVKDTVISASNLNIKTLTLYAFSTENWKRPKSEVDFLMKLPKVFLNTYLPEIMENNIKIETIGEFSSLPLITREAIQYAKEKTKQNDGLLLNFALNYGSRFEIMQAIKQIITDIDDDKTTIDKLDEHTFSEYLYTNGLTDPDLLIRTSGEQRLSNFLLWQLAYTEFWFTDVLWPDFNEDVLLEALEAYRQRKRRYGGI